MMPFTTLPCTSLRRKSPLSLYNPEIATMEADPTKAYNQNDATGFIALNALRLKITARVQRGE